MNRSLDWPFYYPDLVSNIKSGAKIRCFTEATVVPPCALNGAVRKYLQVKSSSAVQLSPPENTLEVRQIGRCAPREPVPGDQLLLQQRAGAGAGALPKRCQHEVGADLGDTLDPENASNFPQKGGRRHSHGVEAERVKFREEVLRQRFCVLRYLAVTYCMFTSAYTDARRQTSESSAPDCAV